MQVVIFLMALPVSQVDFLGKLAATWLQLGLVNVACWTLLYACVFWAIFCSSPPFVKRGNYFVVAARWKWTVIIRPLAKLCQGLCKGSAGVGTDWTHGYCVNALSVMLNREWTSGRSNSAPKVAKWIKLNLKPSDKCYMLCGRGICTKQTYVHVHINNRTCVQCLEGSELDIIML